uniref:Cellulose synthase catalytic subunit n=1 Tax=Haemonchus placei TaxID=6290 RepID=A0A0N4WYP8_HAEPC
LSTRQLSPTSSEAVSWNRTLRTFDQQYDDWMDANRMWGKKAFRGQQADAGTVKGLFLRLAGVIVSVWALGHC